MNDSYVSDCKASEWAYSDNDSNNNNIVFFVTEKKKALIMDIEIPLTYNLSSATAEKITKYENLAVGIKNIWKFNSVSVYP